MSDVSTLARPLVLPPPVLYPEREDRPHNWLTALGGAVSGVPATLLPGRRRARLSRIVRMTGRHRSELAALDEAGLRRWESDLRAALRRGPPGGRLRDDLVARAFALVRERAGRTIGQEHFDVQIAGGYALLKGMVAEMETGEGKTLTATLPACTAALAGIPVHVVTVNDYLARRDGDTMGPVYRALGLSVGVVVHGMTPEHRRAAYGCDVTYCTNKEAAFDYLRDRMARDNASGNLKLKIDGLFGNGAVSARLVMRGLHFAIVDEADSVLIDEARTPLIVSGRTDPGEERVRAEQAMALIEALAPGDDYLVRMDERRIELRDAGKARLAALAEPLGGIWRGSVGREELARNALAARHLFRRDQHYLVRDGKVQIVDEYTGRVMEDRSWSDGLHQMIEVKEGCEVTGRTVTLARMTYQRFFRRYRRLAGMTGTAREARRELWSVYRLPVVPIPTNRPLRRRHGAPRIARTSEEKWRDIARCAAELSGAGRAVLIGTRSVAASHTASRHLARAGVGHVVLNAAQDRDEAEIIARAGGAGRVTVATNMAGRGVDIRLGPGVARRGGLCVIVSERHDARRIDRQLGGRCGRQGEPGDVATFLSLEDPLIAEWPARPFARLAAAPGRLGTWAGRVAFGRAQRKAERTHARMRRDLLKWDRKLGTFLAFAGRME